MTTAARTANFRVSASVEPGTYDIGVRGKDASSTGAFTLTIQMEENSDGSGVAWAAGAIRNLTNNSAPDWDPPLGLRMVATSPSASDLDGNEEIYVMGSDGSTPRNLTNNSAWDQVPHLVSGWSPHRLRVPARWQL